MSTPSDNSVLDEFKDADLSLLEILDHVLSKGLVIAGEITISVADVDLIYLGVNLLVGSTDTIERILHNRTSNLPDNAAGPRLQVE